MSGPADPMSRVQSRPGNASTTQRVRPTASVRSAIRPFPSMSGGYYCRPSPVATGGRSTHMKRGMIVLAAIAAFAIGVVTMAVAHGDFGVSREDALKAKSRQLFGVGTPVPASSSTSIDQATALADPRKLVKLAKGLHAHTVTRFGSAPG